MTLAAKYIAARLDMQAEERHKTRPRRDYLGASVIGHACDAYCVMDMMGWPTAKKGSTIRAGELGHHIEAKVIDDLRLAGFSVLGVDGKQIEFTLRHGRFRCHLDGILSDKSDPRVLEIKSAKHSTFLAVKKKGLRDGHRMYYDQITAAMGLSEINRTVFIMLDKDTGETYCEEVHFDPFHWSYIQIKIDRLLDHTDEVQRVSASREYWRCKQCDRVSWCWGKKPPVGTWMPKERTP